MRVKFSSNQVHQRVRSGVPDAHDPDISAGVIRRNIADTYGPNGTAQAHQPRGGIYQQAVFGKADRITIISHIITVAREQQKNRTAL